EVGCPVGGLEQPPRVPARIREPRLEERELGEAIMPVVADGLVAAGSEAQRGFGLRADSSRSDRGDETTGSVVHLVTTVEFVERRSREPCRVQAEWFDELLLWPERCGAHRRMQAVGTDDEVKSASRRVAEGDFDPVCILGESCDGVIEEVVDL